METESRQLIAEFAKTWARTNLPGVAAIVGGYIAWVESGSCIIRDKRQCAVPLVFNRSQVAVLDAMIRQIVIGKPVRVTVLKARKTGISTIAQTLLAFAVMHHQNQVGVTLAHLPESTQEIAEIAKRACRTWVRGADIQARRVLVNDLDSRCWYHTAGGQSVAVAGTPSMLHLSEVALWKLNKLDTYATSVEAVPYEPDTLVIEESTARGREEFYTKWEAAHDPRHPYEPVFIPWFFDEALHAEGELGGLLDDEETQLIERAARYAHRWYVALATAEALGHRLAHVRP